MSRNNVSKLAASLVGFAATPAFADAIATGGEKQPVNVTAIAIFLLFVFATLGITYWAAQRS